MYESFYGLKERPFSIAPDPRYLFMSPRHKEALAHLAYGVRHGAGFVLLTGEVGTGKTTICRQVLRKLPADTRLAFILNPMLNAKELLATLCDELGVDYDKDDISLKQLTDNLTRFLLECYENNVNVVLMIDEAQNLAPDVLEQIRLLTNLETDQKKLLQIILVGQPELQELLARKDLRQLAQRVTARYHLRPLNQEETQSYIQHRLRIAGTQQNIFTKQAIKAIFKLTEGVPRLINNLCDRALMAAFSEEKRTVNEKLIRVAGEEVMMPNADQLSKPFTWNKLAIAGGIASVLAVGYLMGALSQSDSDTPPSASQPLITSALHGTQLKTTTKNSHQGTTSGSVQSIDSVVSPINQHVVQQQPDWRDRNELFLWIAGDNTLDPSGNFAKATLAKRWSLTYDYERDGDFCRFALDYQMKCESGIENWQAIVEYNRPLNLMIEDNDGQQSWITLHGLNGDQVEIESPKGRRWIKKDWLLSVWSKNYQMIWQAPPGYDRPFRYGDRGEHVNWLAERMAFLYEDDSLRKENVFDEYLQDLLMDFQQRHGLKADGIAGMNTLIQLNTSTVDGIPRLK